VVAYRYLSGVPLTGEEITAFSAKPVTNPENAVQMWMDARKKASAPELAPVDPERQVRGAGTFDSYVNCLDDAFRTASATLAKRTAAWGVGSANLKEWIAGQDQVFSNCSGPKSIPGPVAGNDPVLKADRQYQIAAAAFYAGDWDLARKSFDSPYLKARVSVREATIGGKREAFARAEAELTAAKETALIGYLRASSKPLERLTELSEMLSKPEPGPAAAESMTDFVLLYDKLRDGQIGKADGLTAKSELGDWIETYQLGVHPHAVEKWRGTKKLPWLVAAIASTKAGDADTEELIAEAVKVDVKSPAYATVNYYAGSLDAEHARQIFDEALKQPLPVSSRNLFLQMRMQIAKDWAEFLKFSARVPVGEEFDVGEQTTEWKGGAVFDDEAVLLFNKSIPLSLWIEASKSPLLTAHLRDELATAAWVRAIVLGKTAEAHALAGVIQTPSMKSYLAASPETAQFAAVYLMLKTPGMSPWLRSGFGRDGKVGELSEFRDNWWSKLNEDARPVERFLTEADRAQGALEWKAMMALDNGGDYLAAEAVRYLKANPSDPRGAEALALAVRATHFSTTDEKTGPLSKQAFDLLHANYPNTSFAKNTKYWYK